MAADSRDPWYFPRGELTEHFFSMLRTGLVRRVALFAPRRRGKTWFLIHDVAPAAVKRKIIPVYASLWESLNAPERPILDGLRQALDTVRGQRVQWKQQLERIRNVGLSAGGVSVNWQPTLARPSEASDDDLSAIGRTLRELVANAPGGRVLLMLDEAQHLATDERFLPLVASLRTVLDSLEASRKADVRTLFTGSSRTNLDALVRDPKSPFYQSTEQLELPDLGPEYTRFLADQLKRLGKIKVSAADCERAFNALDRSPFQMQRVIRELMLRRARTIEQAYEITMKAIINDPFNKTRWGALKELDRLVFRSVCLRREIYSASEREGYATKLKRKDVSTALVQRSLERLTRQGLVSVRGHGRYQNEDPEMWAWVKDQRSG